MSGRVLGPDTTKRKRPTGEAVILSDGSVISQKTLNGFAVSKEVGTEGSKVLNEKQRVWSESGCLDFPHSVDTMVLLPEISTPLLRSVKTNANDTVGLGWEIKSYPNIETPNESQKRLVEEFLDNCHDRKTLTDILLSFANDYFSTGNAALEIIISDRETELPSGLENIPIQTLRLHPDRKRVLHRRENQKVWYKLVGVEGHLDYETGVFGDVPPEKRANEILWITNPTPRSSYYGLPDYLPAVGAIYGERKRQEYNNDFFDNYAVPAYAVTVTGTTLTPKMQETIKHYFNTELRKHRHSTLLIQLKKDKHDITTDPIEIKFQALSVDVKEASFQVFRTENVREIFSSMGTPPYRAGIAEAGALGGNVARETTEIYKDSVISPVQEKFSYNLTRWILWDSFEATDYYIHFNEIDTEDKKEKLDMINSDQANGRITPNEARQMRGLPKVEGNPAMDMHYMNGFPIDRGVDILSKRAEYMAIRKELSEFVRNLNAEAFRREVERDADNLNK